MNNYREITTHKVNGCNDAITIEVADEPGHGGACHDYLITGYSRDEEFVANSETGEMESGKESGFAIHFQNGPIAEVGTNGVTHEVLLAILDDRLSGFQNGEYACTENKQALYHVREAMWWLKQRTKKRIARGVEGTHQK